MAEEISKIITATNTITTFRKFKGLMIDLLRGYPQYIYFGKFESVFKENGKKMVDLLVRHEIIEKIPIKEVKKRIETMTSEELEKLPNGKEKFIRLINLDKELGKLKLKNNHQRFSAVIRYLIKKYNEAREPKSLSP